MKQFLVIFFLFFAVQSFSQNLKVTHRDGTTTSIDGKLKANKYGFYNQIVSKENTILVNDLVSISSEKEKYDIIKYEDMYYAFIKIIDNEKMSLYKSKNKYFIQSTEYALAEIPYKEKDGYTFSVFDAGILGVYVNKCQASQNYIHENFLKIRVYDLKKVINSYNSCALESTSTVSETSIMEANLPNELIDFGITVGNSFLNMDYSGLDLDHKKNYSFFNVGAIVTFKPNILNRKLTYSVGINYLFSQEDKFLVGNKNTTVKHGYVETTLGVNYLFLDADSKTNPYIGVAGGLLFNNGTRINLNPNDSNSTGNHYVGSSELIYNINAGVLIRILNQDFNFNVSYIPKTKASLESNRNLESNFQYYNLSGFSLRLSYYF